MRYGLPKINRPTDSVFSNMILLIMYMINKIMFDKTIVGKTMLGKFEQVE